MKEAVLFVDFTEEFIPILNAVQQSGYVPILLGSIEKSMTRYGIRGVPFSQFFSSSNHAEAKRYVASIVNSVGAILNDENNITSVFGVPSQGFLHKGETRNRFLHKVASLAFEQVVNIDALDALVSQYRLLLAVFRTENIAFERAIISRCKQHGIKTLQIAHGIYAPGLTRRAGEYERLHSDFIAVFGARAAELLEVCGVDRSRMYITGSPYWDCLYTLRNYVDKETARKVLNLSQEEHIIAVCTSYATGSGFFKGLMRAHLNFFRYLRESVESLNRPCRLLFRLHPTEIARYPVAPSEKLQLLNSFELWLRKNVYPNTHIVQDNKIPLLKSADIVIVLNQSSTAVETMILECPTVVVVLSPSRAPVYRAEDGLIVLKKTSDIRNVIPNLISNKSELNRIISAQSKSVHLFNYNHDGLAMKRIGDLILKIAADEKSKRRTPSFYSRRPLEKLSRIEWETAVGRSEMDKEHIVELGLVPTQRAVVDINRQCNAKCLMCYYAHTKERWSKPFDKVKEELHAAMERGNTSVDFTGGEPTIYPHMVDVIKYAESIGLHTCIITNGLALERIKRLIDAGCREWLVSIHGFEEKHDLVLGVPGAWKRLNETIELLHKNDCFIRVNCTLTRHNARDLPKLAMYYIEFVEARIVNFINFNPYYEWGNRDQPDVYVRLNDVQVKVSEVAPYLKAALNILRSHNLWTNVRYFPFCVLRGYETHICNMPQVMFDEYEWDYGVFPKTVHTYLNYGRHLQKTINSQEGVCAKCGILKVCGGVNKNYAKLHGYSELSSYRIVSDYPYHFKTDIAADIIIPAYKPGKRLGKLLSEIAAKTIPPYNLIVIGRHQSAALNRNMGLEASVYPNIIMCDDDIEDLPFGWNRQLIKTLKENRKALAVSARLMNKDGSVGVNTAGNTDLSRDVVEVSMIPTACCVFRKTGVRFDPRFIRAGWEDTDFFEQLRQKYGGTFLIDNKVKVVHLNEEKNFGGAKNTYNMQIFLNKWKHLFAKTDGK